MSKAVLLPIDIDLLWPPHIARPPSRRFLAVCPPRARAASPLLIHHSPPYAGAVHAGLVTLKEEPGQKQSARDGTDDDARNAAAGHTIAGRRRGSRRGHGDKGLSRNVDRSAWCLYMSRIRLAWVRAHRRRL